MHSVIGYDTLRRWKLDIHWRAGRAGSAVIVSVKRGEKTLAVTAGSVRRYKEPAIGQAFAAASQKAHLQTVDGVDVPSYTDSLFQ